MARSTLEKNKLFPDFPKIGPSSAEHERELADQAEYLEWQRTIDFGSFPEFLVFRELVRKGLRPYQDFQYQSAFFGGRNKLGGAIVDFIIYNYIAGRVQGEFFHLRNSTQKLAGTIQRGQLEQAGLIVVDMLDSEIIASPSRVVSLLLQGRETSEARSTVQ